MLFASLPEFSLRFVWYMYTLMTKY
uniref:Uncharacterized protein n=1 Tax=Rhizophora mucronata TaxID=61149 RepID=A0A2P2PU11_RHIMU